MGTEAVILIGLALAFGLYMAWAIGANDVANAMGTSVGSGALSLKRALALAVLMECVGACLLGPHVAETIQGGVIDIQAFADDPDGARMLGLGMLAALLSAGVWLQLATYFGWPVSTTHAIIGSIVGVGCVYGGVEAINWFGDDGFHVLATLLGKGGLSSIVAGWVLTPVLAGGIAYVLFRFVLSRVFDRPDPVSAARRWTPILASLVLTVVLMVLCFKGLAPFWDRHFGLAPTDPWPLAFGLALSVVGGVAGLSLGRRMSASIQPEDPEIAQLQADLHTARATKKAIVQLRRVRGHAAEESKGHTRGALLEAETLYKQVRERTRGVDETEVYQNIERVFVTLLVLSAACLALAHGSNTVANAAGPMSVAVQAVRDLPIQETTSLPWWGLALGGIGLALGLATWGWRVIQTVGKRVTELTPSRGFCAQFAAAVTILAASILHVPISTTHTLIGALIGVGLSRGAGALNLNTIRDILVAWVITLPASAGLAIVFFYGLRLVWG